MVVEVVVVEVAAGSSRFVTKFRKGRNCDRDAALRIGEAFGESTRRGWSAIMATGGGREYRRGCVRS